MDDRERVLTSLQSAMERLIANDIYLLERDLSERAITHKLATYLECEFPDFDVDCEYNRNKSQKKHLRGAPARQLIEKWSKKFEKD